MISLTPMILTLLFHFLTPDRLALAATSASFAAARVVLMWLRKNGA